MLLKFFGKRTLAASAGLLLASACVGVDPSVHAMAAKATASDPAVQSKRKKRATPGANFRLTASTEGPGRFNLYISDGEETVVSGSFSSDQIKNFRDVMEEARSFALTDEAVGKGEPQTTRFFNDEDDALIIDVMKFENQSQVFVTYETEVGRITVEGGTLNRQEKKEAGLFYDLLSKVEQELKKLPPSPR